MKIDKGVVVEASFPRRLLDETSDQGYARLASELLEFPARPGIQGGFGDKIRNLYPVRLNSGKTRTSARPGGPFRRIPGEDRDAGNVSQDGGDLGQAIFMAPISIKRRAGQTGGVPPVRSGRPGRAACPGPGLNFSPFPLK
jgi:hypothetical protein